jgi:putative glycosyltransferase (TIGR04348 family)
VTGKRIQIIYPAAAGATTGNRVTAERWARLLRGLGHRARAVGGADDGAPCDLLVALHAVKSRAAIARFRRRAPDAPVVVALTGTDIYRDLGRHAAARRELTRATRVIALQPRALDELPPAVRRRTRVIYQSAPPLGRRPRRPLDRFQVAVVGHLRAVKDPLRAALACRRLPTWSRIRVVHVGRALTAALAARARAETARGARYRWLGELPRGRARRILAASHLLAVTSVMEGSSNAVTEALASRVPVVAARIPGLIGTLGDDYPGYFPPRDTRALAALLLRAETDRAWYGALQRRCAALATLTRPARERAAWRRLLAEVWG